MKDRRRPVSNGVYLEEGIHGSVKFGEYEVLTRQRSWKYQDQE